ELVLVDDGSTDGSREKLQELAQRDRRVRVVLFRRNFGQSAAMAAGFEHARGRVVVTMDGDLQNDPADIPALLEKLDEGYDVVSGWRKNRQDKLFVRKVPSWLANRLICSVTGVKLHDTGCSLKAYRREIIDRIRLYGELHRFIPALARIEGARITELPVRHHPRRFGKSKYNITRTYKVLMDLLTLNIFLKYERNPLYFFGWLAILSLVAGLVAFGGMAVQVWNGSADPGVMNVLLTVTFVLLVSGVQFTLLGLVAKLIVASGDRRLSYLVETGRASRGRGALRAASAT
ncbi:MAG TPA: glycosyltransferase, partial [Bacteroidetes bacterium]|nr:glycosyltransferase [Bacteroidota bacterium]